MGIAWSFVMFFSCETPFFKGVSGKTPFITTKEGLLWLALDSKIASFYAGSEVGKTVWKLGLTKRLPVFCLTADAWVFLFGSFHSAWSSQYSGEGDLSKALFLKDGKLFRVSDGNTRNDRALESFLTFCQKKLKEEHNVDVQAFLFDSEHPSVLPSSKQHTEVFVPEQFELFQFIGNVKVERVPDAPRKRKLQDSPKNSPGKKHKSPTHFRQRLDFDKFGEEESECDE